MVVTTLNPQWVEELKESYKKDAWAQGILLKHQQKEALPEDITVHCGIIRKKKTRIYVGSYREWRNKMIQILHDSNIRVIQVS
jgi:hypothetical protein